MEDPETVTLQGVWSAWRVAQQSEHPEASPPFFSGGGWGAPDATKLLYQALLPEEASPKRVLVSWRLLKLDM